MRPRTDGRLLGAEQRRLAFSDVLILLKPDAAKPSKGHFRSLFMAEKKTIMVSIACKRRGIRWGKNEPTPRVTTEGIKLDGGISLSPSLSLSLSISLVDGRTANPQRVFPHLAKPVEVRNRFLHRRRRPADGVQAVSLEQGVA